MNLGKLLGAGKTFFGGGGKIAYREDKKFHLPKFNANKNPFLPKPLDSKLEVKQITVSTIAAKTQKIPVFCSQQAKTVMPVRAVNWKDKLNPFRAPEPVRSAATGAVQVELSLEAVKVVHNDLADADIEVVPVKSRTSASLEAPMLPPSRSAWEFLGERLVKQA